MHKIESNNKFKRQNHILSKKLHLLTSVKINDMYFWLYFWRC